MSLTATVMEDPQWGRTSLVIGVLEYRGTRFWRVNTADTDRASEAAGLPTLNDPWSEHRPELRLVSLSLDTIGGTDGNGSNGWTRVRAEYELPDHPWPTVHLKYSVWTPVIGSITRVYDVRLGDSSQNDGGPTPPAGITYETPIEFKGVNVEKGWIGLDVVWYEYVFGAELLNKCIDLMDAGATNNDDVAAPPLWNPHPGIGAPVPTELFCPAFSLRYRSFTLEQDRGFQKLTHHLIRGSSTGNVSGGDPGHAGAYVSTWRHPWHNVNDRGLARGGQILSKVYKSYKFQGLW